MAVKGKQSHDSLVFQPENLVGRFRGYEIIFKSIKNTQPMKQYYKDLDEFTALIKEHLDGN